MPNHSDSKRLWRPSPQRVANTQMYAFMQQANQQFNLALTDYDSLWQWSVDNDTDFWTLIWQFCGVEALHEASSVVIDNDDMLKARWFTGATLNYAQHLLRNKSQNTALTFYGENKAFRQLSYQQLNTQVAKFAAELQQQNVQAGDRVAAIVANTPEALVAMLATTALGAVWSSCSPDFGINGIVDRFGQIEPKVLIATEGYYYNGKWFDVLQKLDAISAQLPTVKAIYVQSYGAEVQPDSTLHGFHNWAECLSAHSASIVPFTALKFSDPLFIMFSSGTTGVPKCIVHSVGGTLLQHLKEHQLHSDINPGDQLFYYTTCGWMMWNWMVTALASNASLVLYDGSPFADGPTTLLDIVAEQKTAVWGVSAKYIDALKKAQLSPVKSHDLSSLKAILSTGSPLAPESFEYVYSDIKHDVQLASISGGTDILSCFVLGSPMLPVYRGEIQCIGLGMHVQVLDDDGKRCAVGDKGELCCVSSFPSMPIGFWNDDTQEKYREAYFEQFDNIWCHGDYVAQTESGGVVIYGRSDAVLNPGGVRIGTAEIYRQVDQLVAIKEAIVIGQRWADDVRVVLFVVLQAGVVLDDALQASIRQQIKANTTPRHVPAVILAVADIPRTKSGKIVEVAVRRVVHGERIKNKEALANPEALAHFENLSELAE